MKAVDHAPRVALTVGRVTNDRMRRSRGYYVDALRGAGAEVIVVEPGDDLPEDFDGLVLSGGGDIAPDRFGEPDPDGLAHDVDPERDSTELEAVRAALARDVPVLAICRGFQVLNVARGGSLLLDLADHRPDDPDGVVTHSVTPEPGSLLAAACGEGPLVVNSRHHQAVTPEKLGEGLRATAAVGDLVEAFEATDRRWVVGVQWHPERVVDREMSPEVRGVFDAFVKAAGRTPAPAR
jgi:putative glutamine amidotransferase